MTAPATVAQLAGWDAAELRCGAGRLGQVADRLLPWRTRLDVLGRRLGTAECWSGPAGEAAATAVVELSTVASGVEGAMHASLASVQELSAAAAEAQEWAAGALTTAAGVGVALDAAGQPSGLPAAPSPVMAPDQLADVLAANRAARVAAARAEEALRAAARALGCAREAQRPLAGAGARAGAPVGFDDLTARLAGPVLPSLPRHRGPVQAADWWSGLTAAEQLAEITARPVLVGALDGLPAWARDRANRLVLGAALHDGQQDAQGTAEVVAGQLAELERAGQLVQLLQFDPIAGLVAVAVGDLDAAAAVGVLVPGIRTTPDDDLPALLRDAAAVGRAAQAAAPGLAVATVAWLGYRTPGLATAALTRAARRGGPALDRALDGLAAARATGLAPPPRTTVVAHSYGTVVTGQAVRAPGPLAADALVLLGSPGLAGGGAEQLEVAEVFGAASPADPVTWLGWFGSSPADLSFGDVPLPVGPTQGHTGYHDPRHPTLGAVGQVVAGVRGGG